MISSSLKNMIRDQHVEDEEQQQPPSYASSSSSRESTSVRIINDDNDEGYTSVANHEVVETQGDPPSSSGLKYNIEAEPIDPLLLPEFTSLAQPLGALVEDVHIPVQPPAEDNEGGFCKKNRRTICLATVVLLLICITITSTTFVIFAFSESRKNDAEPPLQPSSPTAVPIVTNSPTIKASTNPTNTPKSIPTTTPSTSPTPPPLLARIVSSGGYHTCAIDVLHKLFCWGLNQYGQVGTGRNDQATLSPTAIEVENDPKVIGLGWYHSCILDILAKVFCWGSNSRGQLGLGDNVNRNALKEVILVSGTVKVSVGGFHTCIITTLKKLWCWGRNTDGQLGTGITSNSNIPIEVVGLPNDISDVSLGAQHTCAIDILSQLYCWGWNVYGQLGLGHKIGKSTPTKVVFENSHVVEVSLGGYHSCIVNNLSQIWCWGDNSNGQLGDGTTTQRTTPTQTSLVTVASKIDLGSGHSCVIDNLSDLWCWGYNNHGQLGLGTNSNTNIPTKVTAVDDVVQVSTGVYFTFLIDVNDNIMSMGRNTYGQLGLGDKTNRNTPTRLPGI